MLLKYETNRLILKVLGPDYAADVLRFYLDDKELFEKYDAILTPCGGIIRNPFESNDDEATRTDIDTMIVENHLAIGNFGGFPSITLPIGMDKGFPFGGNISTKPFNEVTCLNIAYILESKLGYKNLQVKGGQN